MMVYSVDVVCLRLSSVKFEGIVLDRYAVKDTISPLGNHQRRTWASQSGPSKVGIGTGQGLMEDKAVRLGALRSVAMIGLGTPGQRPLASYLL